MSFRLSINPAVKEDLIELSRLRHSCANRTGRKSMIRPGSGDSRTAERILDGCILVGRLEGQQVFSTIGRVRTLDEKHIDTVTSLSGSGPAFVCVILEALANLKMLGRFPEMTAPTLEKLVEHADNQIATKAKDALEDLRK